MHQKRLHRWPKLLAWPLIAAIGLLVMCAVPGCGLLQILLQERPNPLLVGTIERQELPQEVLDRFRDVEPDATILEASWIGRMRDDPDSWRYIITYRDTDGEARRWLSGRGGSVPSPEP